MKLNYISMPQKITLILRPETAFDIPLSDGYQLYSSILAVMREVNESTAMHTHDSTISSISLCPLEGRFERSKRERHKVVNPVETYKFEIGITDPAEIEIFKSIVQPLIFNEKNLHLEKGEMRVEEVSSSTMNFEDLVTTKGLLQPCMNFDFRSPACIQYRNTKIYEMFPHREAIFQSLLSKWNSVCPETLKMNIERDEISRYIIEKPLAYDTHSVVVNTIFDKKKGHPRPIMKQGFVGRCQYTFAKGTPTSVRNGIVALAKFSEYSGVGSAVSRGCGAVKVSILEAK